MAPAPAAPAPAFAPLSAPAPTPEAQAGYSDRRAMSMKSMAAPAPMPAPAVDPTAANPSDSPAQELDKIRLLFTQQRHDEALHRLAAFQQAHPDLPLPDDLRAQLPDHE